MQDRALGEQVAKAGIYLVFSLSLFAFLMFVHGARQFGMAGAAVESDVPSEAPSAVINEAPESLPDDPEPEAAQPWAEEFKRQTRVDALPEPEPGPEPIVPNVYGKEADMAALQAELSRMSAMGFSFSGDLSANYIGEFYATSYCAEAYPHICGGNGVTASGTAPTPGLTVASDWSVLPPGTWIYISGVGIRRVEDSGGAIKGARLDVVLATHSEALAWRGQGNHDVWILS